MWAGKRQDSRIQDIAEGEFTRGDINHRHKSVTRGKPLIKGSSYERSYQKEQRRWDRKSQPIRPHRKPERKPAFGRSLPREYLSSSVASSCCVYSVASGRKHLSASDPLRPDESCRRLVNDGRLSTEARSQRLVQPVCCAIEKGKGVRIDPFPPRLAVRQSRETKGSSDDKI